MTDTNRWIVWTTGLCLAISIAGCGESTSKQATTEDGSGPGTTDPTDIGSGADATDTTEEGGDAIDSSSADDTSTDTTPPDTTPPDTTDTEEGSDGSGDTTQPAPTGSQLLEACRGETGVEEPCTLVTDASACTSAPCERLVVVFSGGEMGCESGAGYQSVLRGYAAAGYAAVCINYFETATGSGTAPYVDEASRIDRAVREATTGAWASAYWTGRDLLLEGISHGATAPVILMARTLRDEQPHWHGSQLTAGCFFDGSYDQAATAALLATGNGGAPCTTPVSYTRGLERYCGDGATAESCDLAANAKAQEDTITEVAPATFAIADFQMFECGSNRGACLFDIIPAPPIESLCRRLDLSPNHRCDFVSLPNDGHLTCHANAYDRCRTWFESLTTP